MNLAANGAGLGMNGGTTGTSLLGKPRAFLFSRFPLAANRFIHNRLDVMDFSFSRAARYSLSMAFAMRAMLEPARRPPLAQPDRVLGFEPRGCRFESCGAGQAIRGGVAALQQKLNFCF